jgi:alkylation response protein AidB-like acyl-CoA dehydrogenase
MDLNDTPEQAEYRLRVRAWLDDNARHAPQIEQLGLHPEQVDAMRAWQRRLADAGFVGITWPQEFGGEGLSTLEAVVFNSELKRAGVPGILDHIGVGNIGPTIIAHGTAEQQERHLLPLLRGDEMWCQLFSEPAAGSDLAGIHTRARREEDGGWRVNGQKVWTTGAHWASFGLMLARTNPDVPKHRGLTMFGVAMDAPGVTVRPLRQTSGASHFNEVFLDDVRLEPDAVIGDVDDGWTVAMTTLMFERLAVLGAYEQLGWGADRFAAVLAGHPAAEDSAVRQRLAAVGAEMLSLKFTAYRTLTALQRGMIPGPEAGLSKITTIDASTRGAELVIEALGPDALDGFWGDFLAEIMGLRSGGGTDEILRTMIGERVLGLPPEPRTDKTQPFSELSASRKAVPA